MSKNFAFIDSQNLNLAIRAQGWFLSFRRFRVYLSEMIDLQEYDKAVIVSGDGDFYCLVKYLIEKSKLAALMIPDKRKYSALLKVHEFRPHLRFMNDLRDKLSLKKEKTPQGRNLEG